MLFRSFTWPCHAPNDGFMMEISPRDMVPIDFPEGEVTYERSHHPIRSYSFVICAFD